MLRSITEKELEEVQMTLYRIHSMATVLEHYGFEATDVYKNRYSNVIGNLAEMVVYQTENCIDIIGEVL